MSNIKLLSYPYFKNKSEYNTNNVIEYVISKIKLYLNIKKNEVPLYLDYGVDSIYNSFFENLDSVNLNNIKSEISEYINNNFSYIILKYDIKVSYNKDEDKLNITLNLLFNNNINKEINLSI